MLRVGPLLLVVERVQLHPLSSAVSLLAMGRRFTFDWHHPIHAVVSIKARRAMVHRGQRVGRPTAREQWPLRAEDAA
jgi:hypothetical protein